MTSRILNQEIKAINKSLPDLKMLFKEEETFIENGIYKKMFISIFDHWLKKDDVNLIFVDNDASELNAKKEI